MEANIEKEILSDGRKVWRPKRAHVPKAYLENGMSWTTIGIIFSLVMIVLIIASMILAVTGKNFLKNSGKNYQNFTAR